MEAEDGYMPCPGYADYSWRYWDQNKFLNFTLGSIFLQYEIVS